MIESLACGTPVVSVEVCSAREILDTHDCGTVIPPGQYRALAAAIVSLLQDPCQRQQWGSQGAQTARQLFHPHRIGQQYAALYWALAQPTDAAAGSQPLNAVTAPALRDK
jgi:glycosyltransferase involved in cell wall biosynthesis